MKRPKPINHMLMVFALACLPLSAIFGQEIEPAENEAYWRSADDSIYLKAISGLEVKAKILRGTKRYSALYQTLIDIRHIHETRNNLAQYYETLLEIDELMNDQADHDWAVKDVVQLSAELAYVSSESGQIDQAIKYYKRAIEKLKKSVVGTDRNYFLFLSQLQHFNQRIDSRACLEILTNLRAEAVYDEDSLFLSKVDQFLGDHYYFENEIDSALAYAKLSNYSGSSNEHRAFLSGTIAEIYLEKEGLPQEALTFVEEGLHLVEEFDLIVERPHVYRIASSVYTALGKFEEALDYRVRYDEIMEEQRSFQDALDIGNVNLRVQEEKAGLENQLADQQINRQRFIISTIVIVAVVLAALIFILIRRNKIITAQKAEILIQKEKAIQSERAKDIFLANMSHEIRTPLNAIIGMLNVLERSHHPKNQEPFLKAMQVSSDRLLELLNDILDLARIESGKMPISSKPMSLHQTLQSAVDVFGFSASEKGIDLRLEKNKELPDWILGDATRLSQILINLIGNALKFTIEGSILVKCTSVAHELQFEITDTGIGIPDGNLKDIFESFDRGNLQESISGTGLGLSIVKQLVERHQGKIWVETKEGEGATFFFNLPYQLAENIPAQKEFITSEKIKELGASLRGMRVLIAEDNEFNAMLIQDDLEWYIPSVQIEIVGDGQKAFERLLNQSFDMVILDVRMPVLDGYQTARKIRLELQELSSMPIVAMTASLFTSDIEKCFEAGMNAYIAKPYKVSEVLLKLVELSSRS